MKWALAVGSPAAVATVALPCDQTPRAADTAGEPGCTTYTAEYALAARLRLEDTPFGAGDGVYDIGPGRMGLRFQPAAAPSSSARVELVLYQMREQFVVDASVLFISAKVTTRTDTRATPGPDGVAATGVLAGRELRWSTPFQGYRTDGTLDCEGSGCGHSGVPPKGRSSLHIGPGPVRFGTLVFAADLDTFTMAFTRVAHTEMPRQTAFITLAGRRMKRDCGSP